jgi:hypothetical protein
MGLMLLAPGRPRPWVAAFASRVVVMLFGQIMVLLGDPYDSSLRIITKTGFSTEKGSADALITRFLAPFANWDGVYFLTIAHEGYTFEKFHAFFPLLPRLSALLRYATAIRGTVGSRRQARAPATCKMSALLFLQTVVVVAARGTTLDEPQDICLIGRADV